MFGKVVLGYVAAAVLAGAGAAQAEDIWGLEAFGDVCPISFTSQPTGTGPMAIRHHSSGCMGGMGNIAGWTQEGDGGTYLFYDRAGQILGRVDGVASGVYEGVFGDGAPVVMRFMGAHSPGAGGGTGSGTAAGNSGTGQGEALRCRVYLNSDVCAEPYDIGVPDASMMMPLARMNVRFSSSLSSQMVGKVDRGMCLSVSRCREETFAEERTWCEVQLEDRSGWVLKQDESTVYTCNSCD